MCNVNSFVGCEEGDFARIAGKGKDAVGSGVSHKRDSRTIIHTSVSSSGSLPPSCEKGHQCIGKRDARKKDG